MWTKIALVCYVTVFATILIGCSSASFGGSSGVVRPAVAAPASGGPVTTSTTTTTTTNTTGFSLPQGVNVPTAVSPMYANTSQELFSIPSPQGEAQLIGRFTINGFPAQDAIYDLGIDNTGHLFAVSSTTLYAVDPTTADLQEIMQHGVPNANGLTALSNGTLVIAGDSVASLAPGSTAPVTLVAPGAYTSSGDIIALPDHQLYWSVLGTSASDQLVRIDPSSGTTTLVGSFGVPDVWGLGYAQSTLYGFTSSGQVVGISNTSGESLGVVANDGNEWTGATTNPVLW